LLTYGVKINAAAGNVAKLSSNTYPKEQPGMPVRDDPSGAHRPTAPQPIQKPRRLKVSELLAGEREAILEHSGQDYRLRITANGKLILTK
jgi:hemin uptake protein HemP